MEGADSKTESAKTTNTSANTTTSSALSLTHSVGPPSTSASSSLPTTSAACASRKRKKPCDPSSLVSSQTASSSSATRTALNSADAAQPRELQPAIVINKPAVPANAPSPLPRPLPPNVPAPHDNLRPIAYTFSFPRAPRVYVLQMVHDKEEKLVGITFDALHHAITQLVALDIVPDSLIQQLLIQLKTAYGRPMSDTVILQIPGRNTALGGNPSLVTVDARVIVILLLQSEPHSGNATVGGDSNTQVGIVKQETGQEQQGREGGQGGQGGTMLVYPKTPRVFLSFRAQQPSSTPIQPSSATIYVASIDVYAGILGTNTPQFRAAGKITTLIFPIRDGCIEAVVRNVEVRLRESKEFHNALGRLWAKPTQWPALPKFQTCLMWNGGLLYERTKMENFMFETMDESGMLSRLDALVTVSFLPAN